MPAAPAPLQTSFVSLDLAAGQVECVEQAGGGDDRGAVLVVMEHRDVEQLAQPLLDDETFRRLDVLEVDAAPALAEESHAIDELVGVLGVHFEVDGIDVGEALEQHRLAFHHGLGRKRAAIAEPENGGAVGDDGDEVALDGVVVGLALVLGDGEHRHCDARRIGQRKIALGRHRFGGDDLELAGTALAVEEQRLLVGEGRTVAAAVRFGGHFNSLLSGQRPEKLDVSGRCGTDSREAPGADLSTRWKRRHDGLN